MSPAQRLTVPGPEQAGGDGLDQTVSPKHWGDEATERDSVRPAASLRPDEILQVGNVVLDLGRHECIVRGEEIKLPLKEFELLEMLLGNPGRVVTP